MNRMADVPRLAVSLTALVLASTLPGATTAQDIPDASVEAIRAYADGAEAYLAADYEEAIEHFRRAHALDATFITPAFMAWVSAGNAGNGELADSLAAVVRSNRFRLSPYYQDLFDGLVLQRQGMTHAAAATLRDLVERYPGTKAAYNYANIVWTVDAHEALRALSQLDPEREPARNWYGYWLVRASALHSVGDLDAALENAREAQRRFPDRVGPVGWEVNVLSALGRAEEVEEAMARAVALPGGVEGVGWRNAGQELMAHGFEREGREMLERALDWYENEDTRTSRSATTGHAYTLYLLGRYAEARDLYRQLDDEEPGSFTALRGMTAALAGDRAAAEEALERVRRGESGTTQEDILADEIAIQAGLGDSAALKSALLRYGRRPLWIHRDPTILAVLGDDADFRSYLAGGR